jgi:hypothetical protein
MAVLGQFWCVTEGGNDPAFSDGRADPGGSRALKPPAAQARCIGSDVTC